MSLLMDITDIETFLFCFPLLTMNIASTPSSTRSTTSTPIISCGSRHTALMLHMSARRGREYNYPGDWRLAWVMTMTRTPRTAMVDSDEHLTKSKHRSDVRFYFFCTGIEIPCALVQK